MRHKQRVSAPTCPCTTKPLKVVIFCGGLGTRLREDIEYRAKPMVPVGNRPILWHIMKHYAVHGHKEFDVRSVARCVPVSTPGYDQNFARRAEKVKADLIAILTTHENVAAYGASAKGSTLLNFIGEPASRFQFIADRTSITSSAPDCTSRSSPLRLLPNDSPTTLCCWCGVSPMKGFASKAPTDRKAACLSRRCPSCALFDPRNLSPPSSTAPGSSPWSLVSMSGATSCALTASPPFASTGSQHSGRSAM